jgi:hypothetical protein
MATIMLAEIAALSTLIAIPDPACTAIQIHSGTRGPDATFSATKVQVFTAQPRLK